jgi:ribose/xylose/arabinose/galactoside ABC-type transport system permease subunit
MKKVIQTVSLIIATFGFVFLLYGGMKLARVEAATVPQEIETGIPGIEIVQPSKVLSREDAQVIIGVSVAALAIGIAGYFVSSRTDFGETVPRIGSSRTNPQPNNTVQRTEEK